jgi:signal transduction histidine kinase
MDVAFLRQLLEISRQMSETRQPEPLLRYTMQQALTLLNAERGYLVLVDTHKQLDFRVKIDRQGNDLDHPDAQISYSILDKVISENKPQVIVDAMTDPGLQKSESVKTLQLRSVMCAPLVMGGIVRGAIYVENRSNSNIFDESGLEPLTFFAAQAAVAIENALLNAGLEAQVESRTAELAAAKHQVEVSWLEAVESNRIRTTMLGNIAHDMRSPIALSVGILKSLQEGIYGPLLPDQAMWIDRARQSLEHAINLTRDLFDLTRAEAGKLEIFKQPVNLGTLLSEITAVAQALPWAAAVQFTAQIEQMLPVIAMDETRIRQVLLNLLSNAAKFTAQGSVVLYAHRLVQESGVLVGIKDTGSGIPLDFRDRIFERYQQGSADPKDRQHGAGLGLAISKELIERHGGRIGVLSSEGEGSYFYFTLPL